MKTSSAKAGRSGTDRRGPSGFPSGGSLGPLLAFAFAVLLRLVYFLAYAREIPFYRAPVVDSRIYDTWARAIAAGDWWSRAEGVFYRAPLYPYVLAGFIRVFGGPVPWALIAQILLGLGTIGLAGLLAARLAGARGATATILLLALYGPLAAIDSKLLPTTLGLFLHVAALWAAIRFVEKPRVARGLAAGVLLGLSVLVRPQWILLVLLLPVVLCGPSWLRTFRSGGIGGIGGLARRWAPFWIGALLVVLPVTARNRMVGGDWVLVSSNGGMTFYQGNNEENRSGLLTIVSKFELFGSATQQRQLETTVAERESGRSLKPSETSAFWTRQALAFIFGRPLDSLRLEARKLYRFVTSYEYADNYSYYMERERLWPLALAFVPFGVLLALGVLGAAMGTEHARGRSAESGGGTTEADASADRTRRVVLLSAGLGLAACLAFYMSSRYRMDVVPALAVLGGAALARLLQRPFPRSRRTAIAGGAAVLVFAASFLPAGVPARSQESITYLQLGNAYEMEKRYDAAVVAYRQSIEKLPINVFAWNSLVLLTERLEGAAAADSLLQEAPREVVSDHPLTLYTRGYLKMKLGDEKGAAAEFRRAIEESPYMREPRYHLALLEEKWRDYEAAESDLSEALALGPNDPELYSHLAYVRIQLRRYAAAAEACRRLLELRPGDPDGRFNLAVADFYLGNLEEARQEIDALSAAQGGKDDPLLLYYRGLIELRAGQGGGASLRAAAAADSTNLRATYYAALAGAAEGGRFDPAPWRRFYGDAVGPALPALAGYVAARARAPWGALDGRAAEALERLEAIPEGVAVAADLRRFLAEERAPSGEDGGSSVAPD